MLPKTKQTSTRYSKVQALHNYLTVDFKQDRSTFGRFRPQKINQKSQDKKRIFFKTFYHKQSSRLHRKDFFQSGNGRQTAMTNRDSVIGTPFNPIEFNDPQNNATVLPSLDLQHYRYLLKAISGLSKTKKLPQYKELNQRKRALEKIQQASASPYSDNNEIKESGSPKVLNLSINFQPLINPFSKGECQNAFQKMFKNKQLLQRGRHLSLKLDQSQKFNPKLLGQEQLRIAQILKQPRQKRTLIK